jgi:hypothetical protein
MTERRDIRVPTTRAARLAAAALALVVGVTGCGAPETTSAGPCDISYDDALFTVTRATNIRTGASISRLFVRGYTFDGSSERGINFLITAPGLQPRNVSVIGSELSCDVACSFGAVNGQYTLTFGAAGFRDTTLDIGSASHADQQGGCPARFRDGLELELQLTPT